MDRRSNISSPFANGTINAHATRFDKKKTTYPDNVPIDLGKVRMRAYKVMTACDNCGCIHAFCDQQ
jgi:hypothetical protein